MKKILLAEDSPQDVEMTLEALSQYKVANDIVVVSDGEQALDYLYQRGEYANREAGNPVVILLDLKMPKVDGMEVLRTVKNDATMKQIPVVMLTSSREEQDLIKSYENGANAYVVKPVDFLQFIEAVRLLGAFWVVTNEAPPVTA